MPGVDRRDLLVELGTEELPAGQLDGLAGQLAEGLAEGLRAAGLRHGRVRPLHSPRRLACLVSGLAARQADSEEQRLGPPLASACPDGKPGAAARGFASSCGLAVEQLEQCDSPKGPRLMARLRHAGRPTLELLPGILEGAAARLAAPRHMRWGAGDHLFARPVRWLLALYGGRVVPVELFGQRAGRLSRGHRVHSGGPLPIYRPDEYLARLRKGRVLADPLARRRRIRRALERCAAAEGGRLGPCAALLDEVAGLVEWPVVLAGGFDADFLKLPPQVLTAVMQSHQRYFPLVDGAGGLLPRFAFVANLRSRRPAEVVRGNERVLAARLADARFFWRQDAQADPQHWRAGLDGLAFHHRLGSMGAKVERVRALAAALAGQLNLDAGVLQRAAQLCKLDLCSAMVGEFGELQGIMGGHYAAARGEDAAVARAIGEHYLPAFATDALPQSPEGLALGLADRLDSLSGLLGSGEWPSGSRDPLGLRRMGAGLVRILIEREQGLDLRQWLARAAAGHESLQGRETQVAEQVLAWLHERLTAYANEKGMALGLRAVRALAPGDLLDAWRRILALQTMTMHDSEHLQALAAAHKRVTGLLKNCDDLDGAPDASLFADGPERELDAAIMRAERGTDEALQSGGDYQKYQQALRILAQLRDPVDRFFDQVMVLTDDQPLRRNRLRLLARLLRLMNAVADIGQL